MNRQIKFKVWYKGQMAFTKTIGEILFEDGHYYEDSGALSPFVVMQFTGLLDKNGKEIYEGDILKGKNLENFDEIAEVKWDVVQWFPLAGHREFNEYEILGNIYENPDLLSKN